MARLKPTSERLIGWVLAGLFTAAFAMTAGNIVVRLLSPAAPDVGDEAPVFVLDSPIDGERIDTADLAGMVLLVDFWETTCVGCVGATPKLNRLFEKYADRGFLVIGVNREPDRVDAVRDFVKTRPVNYPVVIDPGHVSSAYGIYATPTVVLIGADGHIRNKHMGPVTERMLSEEIEAALAAARPRVTLRHMRGVADRLVVVHEVRRAREVTALPFLFEIAL